MAKAVRPPTVKRKPQAPGPQTKLVKPKSKRARRILEAREPKLVEDPKKVLLLYGNKTSQVIKDVLADIGKLKAVDAVKYTRKNAEVRPFEAGGEGALEHFSRKTDAAMFALGSSSKKRPHNLVLGRFYDHRLLDMVELGVDRFRALREFKAAAATVQVGNKPTFVFAGHQFDADPQLRLCKSMLLDLFRGRVVESINLKGLHHVIFVTALEGKLLLRQYVIALKKSGTRIPRVELQEMGPSLDLSLRRVREAPPDLMAEALRQPKTTGKKEKNVSTNVLDGKVGRIYMPRQDLESLALRKMKGLKRERQAAAQGDGDEGAAAAADDAVDMTDI